MSSGGTGAPIYLDYAASTPVDPAVAEAMAGYLTPATLFANPSSLHGPGRRAAAAVELARQQLAGLLNANPREIVWTSGATESDNLAIAGAARYRADRGKHLVTMTTEHKAVSDTFEALEREGFEVTYLPPEPDGRLSLDALEAALRDDTQLVSVMHVNNETGVVQDIAAIGERCRRRSILYHVDAAQSVGKLPIDLTALPVDLLSLTAHKFYGPKGVGALYVADRPGCHVLPLLHGGGQERGIRPGTLPVHQIVGLGAAAALAMGEQIDELGRLERLRDRLWHGIEDLPGLRQNGSERHSFPGILNVAIDGIEGESLLLALEPLCVGTGSACNSANREASRVLRALGLNDQLAQSSIRFSFGRFTSDEDMDTAIKCYSDAIRHLRAIAPGRRLSA